MAKKPPNPKIPTCTVEEAAAILGVGRGTGYDAARKGELPGCMRIGGRFVVSLPKLYEALGLEWTA